LGPDLTIIGSLDVKDRVLENKSDVLTFKGHQGLLYPSS
jgi:hypothetical protein